MCVLQSAPFLSRYARLLFLPDAGARRIGSAEVSTEQTGSRTTSTQHNFRLISRIKPPKTNPSTSRNLLSVCCCVTAGTPRSRNSSYPAVLSRASLKSQPAGVDGRWSKTMAEPFHNSDATSGILRLDFYALTTFFIWGE